MMSNETAVPTATFVKAFTARDLDRLAANIADMVHATASLMPDTAPPPETPDELKRQHELMEKLHTKIFRGSDEVDLLSQRADFLYMAVTSECAREGSAETLSRGVCDFQQYLERFAYLFEEIGEIADELREALGSEPKWARKARLEAKASRDASASAAVEASHD